MRISELAICLIVFDLIFYIYSHVHYCKTALASTQHGLSLSVFLVKAQRHTLSISYFFYLHTHTHLSIFISSLFAISPKSSSSSSLCVLVGAVSADNKSIMAKTQERQQREEPGILFCIGSLLILSIGLRYFTYRSE